MLRPRWRVSVSAMAVLLQAYRVHLRDRVKATLEEEQEWEQETDGIDLDFNMDQPIEGGVHGQTGSESSLVSRLIILDAFLART